MFKAIYHTHFACHKLCKESFGKYLPNAGNMGVFCHYPEEYDSLISVRKKLTEPSVNPDQKYFRLHKPIVIPAKGDVSETTYTYLYIRKPDPYRHHIGDVDFFLEPKKYTKLKRSLLNGKIMPGARVFSRPDLDMIELYNPDIDALGYVSTERMTKAVRIKITPPSKKTVKRARR